MTKAIRMTPDNKLRFDKFVDAARDLECDDDEQRFRERVVKLAKDQAAPGVEALTAFAYIGAAVAEIAGCFAFWAWLRMDKSVWWIAPGMLSLALFAYLLTLVDAEHAGRTYAAYGGVYIVSAILWLWIVEGAKPDRWDLIGATVCLGGAAIILFAPRNAVGL